jgi:hypothetical protein
MLKFGASLAVLGSLIAGQAFAAVAPVARLTSVDGPVLVNQGAGFGPATDATVLHPGDRLLSLRGAHAHLIYANGCAVSLKANAMLTVADMARGASCKVAAAQVADTDFTGDEAKMASGGNGVLSDPSFLIGGTVVAGLAVGIGVAASGGTSSP